MAITTVRVKASMASVQAAVGRIPKALASRSRSNLNACLLNHLAYNLFQKIGRSYELKADGKSDQFGMSWKPLLPATIAARPVTPADFAHARVKKGQRGILTSAENKKWKAIFWKKYAKLRLTMGDAKAKQSAARMAWAILKAAGAKTRLSVFGRRKVKILRLSDRLYDSLCAGTLSGNRYYKPREQIFDYLNGELTMGTGVPYSSHQNKRRRLIPSMTNMVRGGWVRDAMKASAKGLTQVLIERLQNGTI